MCTVILDWATYMLETPTSEYSYMPTVRKSSLNWGKKTFPFYLRKRYAMLSEGKMVSSTFVSISLETTLGHLSFAWGLIFLGVLFGTFYRIYSYFFPSIGSREKEIQPGPFLVFRKAILKYNAWMVLNLYRHSASWCTWFYGKQS